jgi:hypothetical protein
VEAYIRVRAVRTLFLINPAQLQAIIVLQGTTGKLYGATVTPGIFKGFDAKSRDSGWRYGLQGYMSCVLPKISWDAVLKVDVESQKASIGVPLTNDGEIGWDDLEFVGYRTD